MKLKQFCKEYNTRTVVDPNISLIADYPDSLKSVFKRHYMWGKGRVYILTKYGIRSKGDILRIMFVPMVISSAVLSFVNPVFALPFIGLIFMPSIMAFRIFKKTDIKLKDFLLFDFIVYCRLIGTNTGTIVEYTKKCIRLFKRLYRKMFKDWIYRR